MNTKSVPIKHGSPAPGAEKCYTLQEAIDMADCTPGHIHEGPINPATGYPSVYYVCDGDCS